ncbi:DUF6682 family protein [Ottowia thiooxydans]|uniref:phage adaptor protein n=1 Tax=Ottowia thiooxydans TaxID=219182 RepID=UPI000405B10E|nr:DUF6682 family protein [Ottowia thiooxydans]
MQVGELIAAFRENTKDGAGQTFWSEGDIVSYLNEAVQEACERARLIEDRSMSVTLVPGQDTYDLDPSVFEIKRLTVRGRRIDETSVEALDEDSPGWEARSGLPRTFILEQASGAQPPRLRFVPTPVAVEPIGLTVYRGALQALRAGGVTEEPEIPARFHERLLYWVYHRAYLKQDADAFDLNKGAQWLALFVQAFGERPDANVQRKQRDRRPPIVDCSW